MVRFSFEVSFQALPLSPQKTQLVKEVLHILKQHDMTFMTAYGVVTDAYHFFVDLPPLHVEHMDVTAEIALLLWENVPLNERVSIIKQVRFELFQQAFSLPINNKVGEK